MVVVLRLRDSGHRDMNRYKAGARIERKAKAELEEAGYIVTRAAGSKGSADLIAIKVRQIQVKKSDTPRAWTSEIEKMAEELPAAPGVSRELWVWNARCGWEKHVIGDNG